MGRTPALVVAFVLTIGVMAGTASATHGPQLWAGQWNYSYPGVSGGFALTHQDDGEGAELLERIGGVLCPEPTDYFTGAYTIPDEPPPGVEYVDTGKFRGCTVEGNPRLLEGRYQSNSNPAAAGTFALRLDASGETWKGTYQPDGDPKEYPWSGFFDNHFEDGAEDRSVPPYGEGDPDAPDPGGTADPRPEADSPASCFFVPPTITPNPDAPVGLAISGTDRDDVIVGTPGPDRILGLGGNDRICGLGGDDELIGAEGDDQLAGGSGNDLLDAGPGRGELYGDSGNDRLLGGTEESQLVGGAGNDALVGGDKDDYLWGGHQHTPLVGFAEKLVSGPDNDELVAAGGNDKLWGGAGRDRLAGGAGLDLLFGGIGNDVVNGEAGPDTLYADAGNDRLDGGNGEELRPGDNRLQGDRLTYFEVEGAVQVDLTLGRGLGAAGRDAIRGVESVIGSRYDDILRGSPRRDNLAGDAGDDFLYGRGGADYLFGGFHDDVLIGGPDRDEARGGPGFDRCAAELRGECERLLVGAGNR